MTALTSDRNTPSTLGDIRQGSMAADEKIFAGAFVMRNAAGYLVKGVTGLNLIGVRRAEDTIDNTGGANGGASLTYRAGVFRYVNDGTDPITMADIGQVCFVIDDQTVAKTDGTATRSRAGIVELIETQGVWVRFDEYLARAAVLSPREYKPSQLQ